MRIYLHEQGRHDPDAVEVHDDAVIAEALGLDAEAPAAVTREDEDEAVDVRQTFAQAGIVERAHLFLGAPKRIAAGVTFNGERREHDFGPSARVDRVFGWATGRQAFDLGKADAAEHTLALASDGGIPAGDVHLGSLDDGSPGHVEFNLIPKHRYEG